MWLKIIKNRYLQLGLALVIGAVVGYSLFPTKEIREQTRESTKKELTTEFNQRLKYEVETRESALKINREEVKKSRKKIEEFNKTINLLKTENSQLRESKKKSRFKLVKPDGTIVEKEFEESNREEITSVVTEVREEFTRKVASIENKWKTAFEKKLTEVREEHRKELEEAKKTVEVVEKEKIVEKEVIINPRRFGVDGNVSNELNYGVGVQYDLLPPLYIRGQYDFSGDKVFEEVSVGVGISF
jgi:chromosome segregation ATPase